MINDLPDGWLQLTHDSSIAQATAAKISFCLMAVIIRPRPFLPRGLVSRILAENKLGLPGPQIEP
jgi:hypothetical protein